MSNQIRLIVNGVSFYTTKAQIKRGVGDNASINMFAQLALEECIREDLAGFGKTYRAYNGNMQYSSFDVQINL
jgi:hypothetical protein